MNPFCTGGVQSWKEVSFQKMGRQVYLSVGSIKKRCHTLVMGSFWLAGVGCGQATRTPALAGPWRCAEHPPKLL